MHLINLECLIREVDMRTLLTADETNINQNKLQFNCNQSV